MPEPEALAWLCAAVAGSQDAAGENGPWPGTGMGERSGAGMQLGVSLVVALRLRGQVSGGREYCEACPCRWVLRLPWRREKGEQGGPGVEGELRPWEGEAPDSLSTSTHPHQGPSCSDKPDGQARCGPTASCVSGHVTAAQPAEIRVCHTIAWGVWSVSV